MGTRLQDVVKKLTDKHLQSVCLRAAWNKNKKRKWMDDSEQVVEERPPIISYSTGFVINSSKKFALVLACSHSFRPFLNGQHGPASATQQILAENIFILVNFFDGYQCYGEIINIDWSRDLSLLVVQLDNYKQYQAVNFIEEDESSSAYDLGKTVFSICCLPSDQQDDKMTFGTTTYGTICGVKRVGWDISPVYDPNLKIFQFSIAGVIGTSGSPIFDENLQVVGLLISSLRGNKFGVHKDSIVEWLQMSYHLENRNLSANTVVALVAKAAYSFISGNTS